MLESKNYYEFIHIPCLILTLFLSCENIIFIFFIFFNSCVLKYFNCLTVSVYPQIRYLKDGISFLFPSYRLRAGKQSPSLAKLLYEMEAVNGLIPSRNLYGLHQMMLQKNHLNILSSLFSLCSVSVNV